MVVTTTMTDQTKKDITGEATYSSANPLIANVSASGLVTGLAPGDTSIRIRYADQSLIIPVTIKTSLVPRGEIDAPANGAAVSGSFTIAGWYLDPNGVGKMEILIDGEVKGEANVRENRPDIAALFPHYN
ncbi:Ig-like domain-containing protein, partial [Microbacteriaceae bacterium K1510]|nr:Ig-like domain-containing protein [Microbacteriaceae bacterium K1510]